MCLFMDNDGSGLARYESGDGHPIRSGERSESATKLGPDGDRHTPHAVMLTKNPKQARNANSHEEWFGYYAGYSRAFVTEALTFLDLHPTACVVDPWNGSGTTGTCQRV